MEFDRFGDESDPDLLFVLGWGNRPGHAPVRWLIDHLVKDDWHVHTATLPVHVTDVQREWVRPVEDYAADLDDPAVLAHSAGGLTVALTELEARTVTYLSPWWGFPPATESPLLDLLAKIPTDRRFLPSSIDDTDLLGEHATAQQVADAPNRVSPQFIRAVRRAHRRLPPAREDAVCFCSLSDRVVSTRAIGDRIRSDQIRLYDGGHELFSSKGREEHLDTLLGALEDGPDALV
ncbi:MAG: alpha/beta fold hydrolase [Halanaeroarchaeum sp.]